MEEPHRLNRNEMLSVCIGVVRMAIKNAAYEEADYLLEMIQKDLIGGSNVRSAESMALSKAKA